MINNNNNAIAASIPSLSDYCQDIIREGMVLAAQKYDLPSASKAEEIQALKTLLPTLSALLKDYPLGADATRDQKLFRLCVAVMRDVWDRSAIARRLTLAHEKNIDASIYTILRQQWDHTLPRIALPKLPKISQKKQFFAWVREGNMTKVEEAIHRHPKLMGESEKGNTALYIAVHSGHLEMVQLLVHHGAQYVELDMQGTTSLHRALAEAKDSAHLEPLLLLKEVDPSIGGSASPLRTLQSEVIPGALFVLLERGAKLEELETPGETTVHRLLFLGGVDQSADILPRPMKTWKELFKQLFIDSLLSQHKWETWKALFSLALRTPHLRAELEKELDPKVVEKALNLIEYQAKPPSSHDHAAFFNALRAGDIVTAKNLLTVYPSLVRSDGRYWGSYGSPIHTAESAIAVIDLLLERGADINQPGPFGETPLHKAALNANILLMRRLIARGADVNRAIPDGTAPLHSAVGMQKLEVVEFLLEQGADVNQTTMFEDSPLLRAVRHNASVPLVTLLVEHGANIDYIGPEGKTALDLARRNTECPALLESYRANGCQKVLERAVETGRIHVLENYESRGVLTPKMKENFLHYAAERDRAGVVLWLLDRGAAWWSRNSQGETVEDVAVRCGSVRTIKLLFSRLRGLYVYSPLKQAIAHNQVESVRLLLTYDAYLAKRDETLANTRRQELLNMADATGNPDVVTALLERGYGAYYSTKQTFSQIKAANLPFPGAEISYLQEHLPNAEAPITEWKVLFAYLQNPPENVTWRQWQGWLDLFSVGLCKLSLKCDIREELGYDLTSITTTIDDLQAMAVAINHTFEARKSFRMAGKTRGTLGVVPQDIVDRILMYVPDVANAKAFGEKLWHYLETTPASQRSLKSFIPMARSWWKEAKHPPRYTQITTEEFFAWVYAGEVDLVEAALKELPELLSARDAEGVFPLCVAARNGQEAMIKLFLEFKAPEKEWHKHGTTALHVLVNDAFSEKLNGPVISLLQQGIDLELENKSGHTALYDALSALKSMPNVSLCKALLHAGAKVTPKITKELFPVYFAACSKDPELVQLVIKQGGEVHQWYIQYHDGKPGALGAMHVAVMNDDISTLTVLLKAGANVNEVTRDHLKQSPLLQEVSCSFPSLPLIRVLLDHGADREQCDGKGKTALDIALQEDNKPLIALLQSYKKSALHRAFDQKNFAEIALLLEQGERLSLEEEKELAPLVLLAAVGHRQLIKQCVQAGMDVNLCNKAGTSALMAAIQNEDLGLVQWLAAHGADLNLSDAEGITPLYALLKKYQGLSLINSACVICLLEHGAKVTKELEAAFSLLPVAVRMFQANVLIKLLLERGADIHRYALEGGADSGKSAIHVAAEAGDIAILALLLRQGAQVNQCTANEEQDSPLLLVLKQPIISLDVIRLLIVRGADINQADAEGHNALHCALKSEYIERVKLLLEYGAVVSHDIDSTCSPILFAARSQDTALITQLMKVGASINQKDPKGETALHAAARCGDIDLIRFLLSNGAEINACNVKGKSALYYAFKMGNNKAIRLLLAHGAKVTPAIDQAFAPVRDAVLDKDTVLIDAYLKAGANIDQPTSSYNYTALHEALDGRDKTLVAFLLKRGANVHKTDDQGRTALHRVFLKSPLQEENALLAHTLLDYGATLDDAIYEYISPLGYAVSANDLGLFERFIEQGCPVNHTDSAEVTALSVAVLENKKDFIERLFEYGANVNQADILGITPLQLAYTNGHMALYKELLARGARVTDIFEDTYAPLHEAVKACDIPLITQLLNQGANPNLLSSEGLTPLDIAATLGVIESVRCLLWRGAKANHLNAQGLSPFHLACMYGHGEIVGLLLKQGNLLNQQTTEGKTPFYLACEHNQPKILERLKASGADQKIQGPLGLPIYAAIAKGHAEIVAMLLPTIPAEMMNNVLEHALEKRMPALWEVVKPHITDEKKTRFLLYAAENGYTGLVQEMLESNADINTTNAFRETVFQIAARHGHVRLMRFLYNNYREAHKEWDALLELAIIHNQQQMVALLQDVGVGKGIRHEQSFIATFGDVAMVRFFLMQGKGVFSLWDNQQTVTHPNIWQNVWQIDATNLPLPGINSDVMMRFRNSHQAITNWTTLFGNVQFPPPHTTLPEWKGWLMALGIGLTLPKAVEAMQNEELSIEEIARVVEKFTPLLQAIEHTLIARQNIRMAGKGQGIFPKDIMDQIVMSVVDAKYPVLFGKKMWDYLDATPKSQRSFAELLYHAQEWWEEANRQLKAEPQPKASPKAHLIWNDALENERKKAFTQWGEKWRDSTLTHYQREDVAHIEEQTVTHTAEILSRSRPYRQGASHVERLSAQLEATGEKQLWSLLQSVYLLYNQWSMKESDAWGRMTQKAQWAKWRKDLVQLAQLVWKDAPLAAPWERGFFSDEAFLEKAATHPHLQQMKKAGVEIGNFIHSLTSLYRMHRVAADIETCSALLRKKGEGSPSILLHITTCIYGAYAFIADLKKDAAVQENRKYLGRGSREVLQTRKYTEGNIDFKKVAEQFSLSMALADALYTHVQKEGELSIEALVELILSCTPLPMLKMISYDSKQDEVSLAKLASLPATSIHLLMDDFVSKNPTSVDTFLFVRSEAKLDKATLSKAVPSHAWRDRYHILTMRREEWSIAFIKQWDRAFTENDTELRTLSFEEREQRQRTYWDRIYTAVSEGIDLASVREAMKKEGLDLFEVRKSVEALKELSSQTQLTDTLPNSVMQALTYADACYETRFGPELARLRTRRIANESVQAPSGSIGFS